MVSVSPISLSLFYFFGLKKVSFGLCTCWVHCVITILVNRGCCSAKILYYVEMSELEYTGNRALHLLLFVLLRFI